MQREFFKVVWLNIKCLCLPLYSFMRSWITNIGKETIPSAVGTIKYSIVNESIVVRAVLRFVT